MQIECEPAKGSVHCAPIVDELHPDALSTDEYKALQRRFRRDGLVKVTHLLPAAWTSAVRCNAIDLLDRLGERRDLRLVTTGNSLRAMTVVRSELIAEHGNEVRAIYEFESLRTMLGRIAGEVVHPCPMDDEKFLITRLEHPGDTHGWHWGDFSFALIWVVQAPPLDVGGLLQCVTNTSWDKTDPKIAEMLIDNPIRSYYFGSGDTYFLRTDTTLHRVTGLTRPDTRIILNMTTASAADLQKRVEGDDRWWDNADVAAASAPAERACGKAVSA